MIDRYAPEFWHSKAEEALARADEIRDPDARRTMLQIAMMYSAMALRLETWWADRRTAA
jgi:hypothetical protein